MKKILSILLSVVMICGISIVPVSAAVDTSQTYTLTLSSGGERTITVAPDEEVTIQLTLDRTDRNGDFPMYAFTSVVRYNENMLELVDSKVLTGVDLSQRSLTSSSWIGWCDLTFNALAKNFEQGEIWTDPVDIASLTFKAKSVGSSMLMIRSADVSTYTGMNKFQCETYDAQVVIRKPTDYTELNQTIQDAQDDLDGTKVSKDGSDIPKSEKWVTQESADLLKRAIDNAQKVADNSEATSYQVSVAAAGLKASIAIFDNAKNDGTKSDGGGDVTPPTPTKYNVVINETVHGTVSADTEKAASGSTVKITTVPDEGYLVDSVTVTSGSTSVEVTKEADGVYTFVQPNGDAAVSVAFKENSTEKDCPSKKYTDVNTNAWYHEAVDFVLNKSYYNGTSATTFEPDGKMTRAMFVTVLSRMEGIDASAQTTGSRFTDVEAGSWYEAAVNWAADNSIVSGVGDGRFEPDGTITREQMAAILYRYAVFKKVDVSGADSSRFETFKDKNDVSGWAKDSVIWATSIGIINGMGDGTLVPQGDSTRAQVAQIVKNYSSKVS